MAGRRVKKAPYFRLYCGFWRDWRVVGLSLDAELVWLRSIAYSKAEHLDGFMPEPALLELFGKITTAPSIVTKELVDAGLWIPDIGGWIIRSFTEYQTTSDEDDDIREKNREYKRAQRERDRQRTNGDGHEPG